MLSFRVAGVPQPAAAAHGRKRQLRAQQHLGTAARSQESVDWQDFAQAVSGEWEGTCASFSPTGEPQQLPEHFVPGAFRDWGVELFDWGTQCSCAAAAELGDPPRPHLTSSVRRLMPTVGCEADAIAFVEELQEAGALGYSPRGDYSTGPARYGPETNKLQLEHVLAYDEARAPGLGSDGSSSGLTDACAAPRSRLRLVHLLTRDWASKGWGVKIIELHRERYEGPYNGRRELSGCGGGVAGFAKQPPSPAEALQGSWVPVPEAHNSYSSSGGDGSAQLQPAPNSGPELISELQALAPVLLPLGAWSKVLVRGEDITAQAGLLLTEGSQAATTGTAPAAAAAAAAAPAKRVSSTVRYIAGRMTAVHIAVEEQG